MPKLTPLKDDCRVSLSENLDFLGISRQMFGFSNQGFSELNGDIDKCDGESLHPCLSGIICVSDKIQDDGVLVTHFLGRCT